MNNVSVSPSCSESNITLIEMINNKCITCDICNQEIQCSFYHEKIRGIVDVCIE
jgi:hypothetical protein